MERPQRKEQGEAAPPRLRGLARLRATRRWFWQIWTDETVAVYRRTAAGQRKARIRLVRVFLFVRELYREFWRGEITARAASLAYTTLLSLIPLLVVFSQRLGTWFSDALPQFRARLDQFLNLVIPYESAQFASHINRFLENAGAASGVGGLIFLLVAFRLFMAVEGAVNQIWRVETVRGYKPRLRAFTMIFFWGPLLIGMSFSLMLSMERNRYASQILYNHVLATVFPVIVLFIGFTMLFWLVPATRVQLKSAAIGALVAALAFEMVRSGFRIYAEALFAGRMNVIYGTLGLFVVFLMAVELLWVVILLGVAVSYVYQNLNGILRASEQQLQDRPTFDLYFALRAMVEIARRFEQREDAPSSYRLAAEFGSTDAQMLRILRKLEDAGLVKEIGGDWTGYVPGGDANRITVEEVIQQMEGGNREIPAAVNGDDPARPSIAEIFQTIRGCTRDALDRISIGQMVREVYGPQRPSRAGD
ncbi:MAG TPA: YhjD/YihY/BrkB family envelope integrity protein [Thermoanaerobaculia bacterium]